MNTRDTSAVTIATARLPLKNDQRIGKLGIFEFIVANRTNDTGQDTDKLVIDFAERSSSFFTGQCGNNAGAEQVLEQ